MSRSPTEAVGAEDSQDYLSAMRSLNRMILEGGSLSGREQNCVFLNKQDNAFENISAVSGLDFPDDGRAVATVDWDHDGDLDLWLVNRNGPQVRFMRNDTPTDAHFLLVGLVGQTCNRDAIGARLELYLKGGTSQKLIQTLRAGEGYLSQSSKWLHFGLGGSTEIDRLVVKWPGGAAETFRSLEANRYYRLTQNTGIAEIWTLPDRKIDLMAKKLEPPSDTAAARVRLALRPHVGPLNYRDFEGNNKSLSELEGKSVLLNLWASWCPPCVKELRLFGQHQQLLGEKGIEIIALNLDGLGDENPASPDQSRKLLARLDFPFLSGIASHEVLHRLEVMREELFRWRRPLAVPTSFLIDAKGRVFAIYTGPVEIEDLVADLERMDTTSTEADDLELAFAGRWSAPPLPINNKQWNQSLAGAHYDLALELTNAGSLQEALVESREALRLDPDHADAHNNLGGILTLQSRRSEAIQEYREALRINPAHREAHNNLAIALFQEGSRIDEAISHFRRALEIDNEQAAPHVNLSLALAGQGKIDEAIHHGREALRINPEHPEALNLVAYLLATRQSVRSQDAEEAVRLAQRACQLTKRQNPVMLDTLAIAYAAAGQFRQAVAAAEQALRVAKASGQTEWAEEIGERLELYRRGLPFRDSR